MYVTYIIPRISEHKKSCETVPLSLCEHCTRWDLLGGMSEPESLDEKQDTSGRDAGWLQEGSDYRIRQSELAISILFDAQLATYSLFKHLEKVELNIHKHINNVCGGLMGQRIR
jgi:hypothetical protein